MALESTSMSPVSILARKAVNTTLDWAKHMKMILFELKHIICYELFCDFLKKRIYESFLSIDYCLLPRALSVMHIPYQCSHRRKHRSARDLNRDFSV